MADMTRFNKVVHLLAEMKGKKILIVTPELSYYTLKNSTRQKIVKAGGLADMVTTLVESLGKTGIRPYVAVPYFRRTGIDKADFDRERLILVEDKRYSANKSPYDKDIEGFSLAFQSRVLNDVLPRIRPDIIHCHDWPTGLIGPLAGPGYKSLFTLHNVHTKTVSIDSIRDMGLPQTFKHRLWLDKYDWSKVNLLLSGIYGSDWCNTPSQRWLEEILDREIPINAPPRFGELIRQKERHIVGILNSPDASYDPGTDDYLFPKYDLQTINEGKLANKLCFQGEVGLEPKSNSRLVVWTNRADPNQKGIDLLNNMLPRLLNTFPKLQIAIISDGHYIPTIEQTVSNINQYAENRRVILKRFSDKFERKAYAAADGVLNFSRYAPCELVHMKGARYGAVPIVRAVGGIAQTVHDYRNTGQSIPGIVTETYSEEAMLEAFRLFYEVAESGSFDRLREDVMECSKAAFQPENMAREYIRLYETLMGS